MARREDCQRRVAELTSQGHKATYGCLNVRDKSSVAQLLAKAKEVNGRVDVLVNAAGINLGTPFLDHGEENWQRILDVNLLGTVRAMEVFGAHMIDAGGGSIVNIGSVTSILPLSRVHAYSASKAAVSNVTRNAAAEWAKLKVRVNAICPGFLPAEQNRALLTAERVAKIMGHTPMERYGEPDELIGALLLLASPTAGSFITGTHIDVDGGFMSRWL